MTHIGVAVGAGGIGVGSIDVGYGVRVDVGNGVGVSISQHPFLRKDYYCLPTYCPYQYQGVPSLTYQQ